MKLYVVPALFFISADSALAADEIANEFLDSVKSHPKLEGPFLDESRPTALYQLPTGSTHDICAHYGAATTPYGDDRLRAATELLPPSLDASFVTPGVISFYAHSRHFEFTTTADEESGIVEVRYTHAIPGPDGKRQVSTSSRFISPTPTDTPEYIAGWIWCEVERFAPEALLASALDAYARCRKVFALASGDSALLQSWGVLDELITTALPSTSPLITHHSSPPLP